MDLILWRHAEAEELSAGVDDPARGLTPKGERHARRVAEWLNQVLPHSTKILVSPSLRTRQTAEALERKFKVREALAPEGTVDGLLAAVRWPDASEPVLVIGHQPTLGFVASYLVSDQPQNWAITTGAVWWVRSRQRDGEAQVILQAVQSPDCL